MLAWRVDRSLITLWFAHCRGYLRHLTTTTALAARVQRVGVLAYAEKSDLENRRVIYHGVAIAERTALVRTILSSLLVALYTNVRNTHIHKNVIISPIPVGPCVELSTRFWYVVSLRSEIEMFDCVLA